MNKNSRYSGVGQVSNQDADGILRLFTDSVASYVENASQRTRQPDTWEPARRERADARGYAYVGPDTTCLHDGDNSTQSIYELRTDGELARICGIGFKQYHLLQRWVVLHHLTRETGKQGFTRAEFDSAMQHYGVKGCDAHNTRLLRRGHGFYWQWVNGMVYPVGYRQLTENVIKHAADHNLHDLYLYGNHPGQRRDMYINCNGSGADFEAQILASWYALHGSPTISRYTLEILLGRDSRSIRRMEKRAGIRITFNEAQTTDPAAVPLKADGTPRGDVTFSNGVWSSRLPNTYTAGAVRQHPYRGQGYKAACWFKSWLDASLPGRPQANVVTDMGKLNCVRRTYCETDKALKSSRKHGYTGELYVPTLGLHKGRVWKVDTLFEDIYD